jgi:5'-nucleotidase
MRSSPSILVTNDDGYLSPGLHALVRAASRFGEVYVVAPASEQSAISHGISVNRKLPYRMDSLPDGTPAHVLDGTPADCVKLALTGPFERRPDIVLSGINPGANIGNNILYSGTVSAAREAAMYGIPAVAISVGYEIRNHPIRFDTAEWYMGELLPTILERGMPRGVLLNVNVPNIGREDIAGVALSRQGHSMFIDVMTPHEENGSVYAYNNVGDRVVHSQEDDEMSDDKVLAAHKISITPLHFDLTHEAFRQEMQGWFPNEFPSGF